MNIQDVFLRFVHKVKCRRMMWLKCAVKEINVKVSSEIFVLE